MVSYGIFRIKTLGVNRVFKLKDSIYLFVLITVSLSVSAQSSIRNSKELDSLVRAIAAPVYNLHHDEAVRQLDALAKRIPLHPIVDMLYAMNIMW